MPKKKVFRLVNQSNQCIGVIYVQSSLFYLNHWTSGVALVKLCTHWQLYMQACGQQKYIIATVTTVDVAYDYKATSWIIFDFSGDCS